MAATRRKVLLIDLDPQGNATMGSGVDKYSVDNTAYELLIEQKPIEEVIIRETNGKYHLVAANGDTTAADIKLMEEFAREQRLANALKPVVNHYDFIFIDCPPSLSMLTVNAMAAADSILVPMQCEYFALEGLTALMDTIERLAEDVSEQLKNHFGDKVYRTVIPRNVHLAEATSFGSPAMYYDKSSAGAKAYLALAGEIIRRAEQQKQADVAAEA